MKTCMKRFVKALFYLCTILTTCPTFFIGCVGFMLDGVFLSNIDVFLSVGKRFCVCRRVVNIRIALELGHEIGFYT